VQLVTDHPKAPLFGIRTRLREIDEAAARAIDPAPWLRRAARLAANADPDPGHGRRVALLAERLAGALGWTPESAKLLRHAAELHDIGKSALPRSLLTQAGPLNETQRQLLVLHTVAADWLLDGLTHPVLQLGRIVGRAHHERWDGTGYPGGTAGTRIPASARLVAASDVWDALTHPRPYRPAYSTERATEIVMDMAGRTLDPDIAAVLLHLVTS
jgi:HD-GYP domain-containing protein (c-di-GMP phosphodiesterase class II)